MKKDYTKHYYAECQRIASKLGGGWAQAGYNPLNDHLTDTVGYDYAVLNGWLVEGLGKRAECVGMEWNNLFVQDGFDAVYYQHTEHEPESNQYFYHPDHLGSSSFITNASGNVDQHLQYLPFGEPWIDQRSQNNIRFTFSGKERDEETGYNYFGARYYNSDISIWLSVDPLSDKFPSMTGYNYCFNNPLKLIDPDRREPQGVGDPPKRTTQILQTFEYDKTQSGMNKRTGMDIITKTVVNTTGQVSTTVVTSLTVDAEGVVSPTGRQFAFTSSGTGDNWEFAMTTTQDVPIDKLDSDLVSVAKTVGEYKSTFGDSPLQTKADELNKRIAVTAGVAAALVTQGSSFLVQIGTSVGASVATSDFLKISPEDLSTTHKFLIEDVK